MIVYNVQRRFFDMKLEAERYRIEKGLPRTATLKIEINDRRELAALLNGLCEPPARGSVPADFPAPATLIDDAFVSPDVDVPRFLVDSWAKLLGPKQLQA